MNWFKFLCLIAFFGVLNACGSGGVKGNGRTPPAPPPDEVLPPSTEEQPGGDEEPGSKDLKACLGVKSGESVERIRYRDSTVSFGSVCQAETQTAKCSDGKVGGFSGTFTNVSCEVSAPSACEYGGITYGHLSEITRTMYESAAVSYGQNCSSETQTASCDNGIVSNFSGAYAYASCEVVGQSCDYAGDQVAHGQSAVRTRYEQANVAFGSSCSSESQSASCVDGTLGAFTGTYSEISCSVAAPLDCDDGGSPVAHGASISRVRYEIDDVMFGGSCNDETQTATCNNGVFEAYSGSFSYDSCQVQNPADCSHEGDTVVHGASATRDRFHEASVPFGGVCGQESQNATCHNGTLSDFSGTATFLTCQVEAPADCSFDGDVVAHGNQATREMFQQATVAFGSSCSSETQTASCVNGTLSTFSGSFAHISCSVEAPADCEYEGQPVVHGANASRERYQSDSLPFGQSCSSETQTSLCHDGTLGAFSGTYNHESCVVAAPADCTLGSETVAHGSSFQRVRYQSMIVQNGQSCASETQESLCSNGTAGAFDGTYTFESCNIASPSLLAAETSGGRSSQRKTFYDPNSSLHWVFYRNADSIEYAKSLDGYTWAVEGSFSVTTDEFAISSKVVGGVSRVSLVVRSGHSIRIHMGEATQTGIAFAPSQVVFAGTSENDLFARPNTYVTDSGDVYVVAIQRTNPGARGFIPYSRKFDAGSGLWGNVTAVTTAEITVANDLMLAPYANSMILVANSDQVLSWRLNEVNGEWSSIPTGGEKTWETHSPNALANSPSSVVSYRGQIYVGGEKLLKWDGVTWTEVLESSGNITALMVHNDLLYIGGYFWELRDTSANNISANNIATYDGSTTRQLGQGLNEGVNIMHAMNGDVYIAGYITCVGFEMVSGVYPATSCGDGPPLNHIVRWNGTSFQALGTGVDGEVSAMTSVGGVLYVGGSFTQAGGNSAPRIASWDGSSWSQVGDGFNSQVITLATYAGELYAGGSFTADSSSSNTLYRIAKWNGSSWSQVGGGTSAEVLSLKVVGDHLYISGLFVCPGGVLADSGGWPRTCGGGNPGFNYLARWDGVQMSPLGRGLGNYAGILAEHNGKLLVSGQFTTAGNVYALYLTTYDPDTGEYSGSHGSATLSAIAIANGKLYVAATGAMSFGGKLLGGVARWDGTSWTALGNGLNGAAQVFHIVSDNEVYAGGAFTCEYGASATGSWPNEVCSSGPTLKRLARWNGTSWSQVGEGVNAQVSALAMHQGRLVLAGSFTLPVSRLAVIDNENVTALVSSFTVSSVTSLLVRGTDLFVAGNFTAVEGVNASRIARFDGTDWHALGAGLNNAVSVLAQDENYVYAGGSFTCLGGANVSGSYPNQTCNSGPLLARVARWDGTNWSAMGQGADNVVSYMHVAGNDQVYVSGSFLNLGGQAMSRIGVWNGATWTLVGGGVSVAVRLAVEADGTLWIGGASNTSVYNSSPRPILIGGLARQVATGIDQGAKSGATIVSDGQNVHLVLAEPSGRTQDLRYYVLDNSETWSMVSHPAALHAPTSNPTLSYNPDTQRVYLAWDRDTNTGYTSRSVVPGAPWDDVSELFGSSIGQCSDETIFGGLFKIMRFEGEPVSATTSVIDLN